ncbi:MAG TPA: hypothetical protein VMD29_00255 [Terracidiphilus sp.]|nr:hypothetical protein [Terracidiphilus sp.]
MKRWQWIVLVVVVLAVGWYFYRSRLRKVPVQTTPTSEASNSGQASSQPANIDWQSIDRQQDGFKLEMPAGPKQLEVPAYNEKGSSEPVEMLYSDPDGATTFAVTWEDNPPVARVNDRVPDRTLEAARDGMVTRTHTSLMTQSRSNVAGFPALDLTAKNSGGGILDARLIYVHGRLYTLIATFPSWAARREQDVIRFYNSFTPATPAAPQTTRGRTS